MGCFSSKELQPQSQAQQSKYAKPKWRSETPMTKERLTALREEFWDTQPHYGGSQEIWDALKAACEAPDMETTRLLVESAGIIVSSKDMTVCYDERGSKYDLPKFVLSDPINVLQDAQNGPGS